MDIKKYIESGVLEHYVLGLLSEEERLAIERMAEKHPEVKTELNAIEDALAEYAQMNASPVSEELTDKIMSRISEVKQNPSAPADGLTRTLRNLRAMAAVLSFLLICALAAIVWQLNISQKQQTSIGNARAIIDSIQNACSEKQAQFAALQEQLIIIRDPSNRQIILEGTERAPEALAAVFYNDQNRNTYLDVRNLPEPPTKKQYQLWAIVSGQPVDMGVFDVPIGALTFIEVPFIEDPDAFAVTLEDQGGSPLPTLEQMYLIGNV